MRSLGLTFLLPLVLCAIIYWPVVKYPYLQDDWGVLSHLSRGESPSVLVSQFLPESPMMYRPLPWLYFSLLVKIAGFSSGLHHVLMLILHTCTSFLVLLTVRKLGEKDPIPLLSGFLYLTAVSVHMDPMMWLVGTYDLAAAFFFFLTLLLFLSGKDVFSALSFLGGLLCKESVLPLPILLLLILVLVGKSSIGGCVRRLWPHLLVMALYLAFRITHTVALPPVDGNPYAMQFSVSLAVANLVMYVRWIAEAGMPLQGGESLSVLFLVTALLLLVLSWIPPLFRRLRGGWNSRGSRELIFWPAWIVLVLLPVLFLRDHAYRYYLTYALVPGFVVLLRTFARILRLFGANQRVERGGMILYAGVLCFASFLFLRSQDDARWNERPLTGTNRLIGKGSEVLQVRRYMEEHRNELRTFRVILLDGLDASLFASSLGPRMWLNHPALEVYPSSWGTLRGDTLLIAGSSGEAAVKASDVRVLEAELVRGNWTGVITSRSFGQPDSLNSH